MWVYRPFEKPLSLPALLWAFEGSFDFLENIESRCIGSTPSATIDRRREKGGEERFTSAFSVITLLSDGELRDLEILYRPYMRMLSVLNEIGSAHISGSYVNLLNYRAAPELAALLA